MYLALNEDFSSISGAVFGHKAETPGLGAEITESKSFYGQFGNNKNLFDSEGNFISVKVLKGTGNDKASQSHYVDGITGATMTCNGVNKMFQIELKDYVNFLKKNQN
jgi:Na+-transporting NADH:ubiquinone oxidoreductase subunit C